MVPKLVHKLVHKPHPAGPHPVLKQQQGTKILGFWEQLKHTRVQSSVMSRVKNIVQLSEE